ncbi:MAG: DUF2029 domain-containing protein [Planctomycetia bacterium]|nr:DUF2029 domain-containing protein [Planctomycetia bacterium]
MTRLSPQLCAVLTSNAALLAAFALFSHYLRARRGGPGDDRPQNFALWAFALLPSTFFWRMGFSESCFLAAVLLAMLGMRRRWPPLWIALAIGLATACRPVGVALLLPFGLYLWRQAGARWLTLLRGAALFPLACWGLLGYMGYLHHEFGDALAFAKTQELWRNVPVVPWSEKALMLVSLEPVWSVYVEGYPGYWRLHEREHSAWFSLHFSNPIFFVGTACLVGIGAWKRWLTDEELLLSLGLLGMCYATRAYEMSMQSQARFASVVFPVYIVLGHLLARAPRWLAVAIFCLFAAYLFCYSALFATGSLFI